MPPIGGKSLRGSFDVFHDRKAAHVLSKGRKRDEKAACQQRML